MELKNKSLNGVEDRKKKNITQFTIVAGEGGKSSLKDIGNKDVGDTFAVSVPILTILLSTTLHITRDTVSQDDNEEADVEVRQERAEASDQTPGEGHDQIGSVMRFAHNTPPTVSQQQVTVSSLDVARILNMTVRQLRESIASNIRTVLFHTESILLRVTGVENVVGRQQGDVQSNGVRKRVGDGNTGSFFELHQVDGGIAVGEWNTSHIPKHQHETYKKIGKMQVR